MSSNSCRQQMGTGTIHRPSEVCQVCKCFLDSVKRRQDIAGSPGRCCLQEPYTCRLTIPCLRGELADHALCLLVMVLSNEETGVRQGKVALKKGADIHMARLTVSLVGRLQS